jgi:hypothetical protein
MARCPGRDIRFEGVPKPHRLPGTIDEAKRMTPEDKRRALGLENGSVEPLNGFECHFLRVLRGEARPASPIEREWFEWVSHDSQRAIGSHGAGDFVPMDGSVVARLDSHGKAVAPEPEQKKSRKPRTRKLKASPESVKLMDLCAVATSLSAEQIGSTMESIDPLIRQAIEMTTNRKLESLSSDPESLQAAVNAAKGKYFELLVVDKLNAGHVVGDIELKAGQTAELAQSMNQPGWDVAILDSESKVVEVVQLKATDSVSYIRDTLDRYPDIRILTTEEAAKLPSDVGLVLDSGISDAKIEQLVGSAIDGTEASLADSFVDAFNPLLPLLLIAGTEGYKIAVGKQSAEAVLSSSGERAGRSLTGGAIGALFMAMGFGWVSILPAVLAARAGPEGVFEGARNAVAGTVKWLEQRREQNVAALPAQHRRWAQKLTEMARAQGIDVVFTAEYVASSMDPSTSGFPVIGAAWNGWELERVFSTHPAVREYLEIRNQERRQAYKRQLLRRIESEGRR